MEGVHKYLSELCGINSEQLEYVFTQKLLPEDDGNNPPTNYSTIDEEMIARAPIIGPGNIGNPEDLDYAGPFLDQYMTETVTA